MQCISTVTYAYLVKDVVYGKVKSYAKSDKEILFLLISSSFVVKSSMACVIKQEEQDPSKESG